MSQISTKLTSVNTVTQLLVWHASFRAQVSCIPLKWSSMTGLVSFCPEKKLCSSVLTMENTVELVYLCVLRPSLMMVFWTYAFSMDLHRLYNWQNSISQVYWGMEPRYTAKTTLISDAKHYVSLILIKEKKERKKSYKYNSNLRSSRSMAKLYFSTASSS